MCKPQGIFYAPSFSLRLQATQEIGFFDHQRGSPGALEVRRLLRDLERYMDPGYIEIKGFWDRKKAFREAFRDAIPSQEIVRSAKNEIEKKLKDEEQNRFHKEVQKRFDDFESMLKDCACTKAILYNNRGKYLRTFR